VELAGRTEQCQLLNTVELLAICSNQHGRLSRLLASPVPCLLTPACLLNSYCFCPLLHPPQKLNDDMDDYWKTAPKKGDAPAAAAPAAAPEAAAEEEAAAE
jgi:hypothetical protein